MFGNCKPYNVRIYLFGIFKRGGQILNIPERINQKAFVKQYLKDQNFKVWKYRIKITPWETK